MTSTVTNSAPVGIKVAVYPYSKYFAMNAISKRARSNTAQYVSINSNGSTLNSFKTPIPPMSASAMTNIDIGDSKCSHNSGTLLVSLPTSHQLGIWMKCQDGFNGYLQYTLAREGDLSWNVTMLEQAESGAYSLAEPDGTSGGDRLEQFWNDSYVVSLFMAIGDDDQNASKYGNVKAVLVINPNNAGTQENGVNTQMPWD